jgi:hypothetical protein
MGCDLGNICAKAEINQEKICKGKVKTLLLISNNKKLGKQFSSSVISFLIENDEEISFVPEHFNSKKILEKARKAEKVVDT